MRGEPLSMMMVWALMVVGVTWEPPRHECQQYLALEITGPDTRTPCRWSVFAGDGAFHKVRPVTILTPARFEVTLNSGARTDP
jgi:hypothetical protein